MVCQGKTVDLIYAKFMLYHLNRLPCPIISIINEKD